MTGNEIGYVQAAHARGQLAGNGYFTSECNKQLETTAGSERALLTPSATAALEMTAILANLSPGDEVIMPSYTFVSTASAFVRSAATPVFVDIRSDTLNIDERLIESAITPRSRAIVVVHYAGVACAMDSIVEIANRHNLILIEDAAQAIFSSFQGRALGGIGDLGVYSFHETKNITCGEGGALLVNRPEYAERAEIIWEKGTDRSKYFRGQVDKYSWVDVGSSFLAGEISASFLKAQLEQGYEITRRRLDIWNRYYESFSQLPNAAGVRLPHIPQQCEHNAHMFYLLVNDIRQRTNYIEFMRSQGIACVFHYSPLHTSPMGRRFGRTLGELTTTIDVSERLVRLPLWIGVEDYQEEVIGLTLEFFNS